nr:helix-turn-helix domain-containing protein [Arthrobacter sp. RIT-PI-e]
MTVATSPPDPVPTRTAPQSQTLSRGIRALEVLAASSRAMSISEVAGALEVHRSIAYRILRTLEDHGLVQRDTAGCFHPGPGLAGLARGVARDLQSVARPELTVLAASLQMTAFIAVWDRRECVTLMAVEPPHGEGTLVQRPGSRHSFGAGAPGMAIQAALGEHEWARLSADEPYREESRLAARNGYASSSDEVIPGVSSVAAAVHVPGRPPAALAVVYLNDDRPTGPIGAEVVRAAHAIERQLH